jgi:arylsulfatase A-like enzyme
MYTTYRTLVATLCLCATSALADPPGRPNIIFMLSDNLGYGDLGSYGGGVIRGAPTPNLDTLAAEGIRFSNFNVEAECTPSRSALMTGRYAIRSGTTRAMPVPGIPQGLAPWEYTMAEMLKDVGYDTAMLGKWHIGASPGRFPNDQGFDSWWGFPNSTDVARFSEAIGFDPKLLPKFYLYEGTAANGAKPVEEYTLARRPYIDEAIEQRAIDYLGQHADSDKPFFLFVSWSLVHHPSLPHPDFAGKSGNGRYSDVMMEHDFRVGRILDALDSAGLAEDTLVVYASDNGPDRAEYPFVGDTGPYRGYLGSLHEGSVRTPMMMRWPGTIDSNQVNNEIVAIHDFFPTFATLSGGEVPDDRAVDGVDQSALFLGETDKSARDSVLFFHDDTLLAMKWKQFKIYLQKEGVEREDKAYHDLWAPEIYNTLQDPKEANNIVHDGNLWMMAPLLQKVMPFAYTVDKYGLIQPGADERSAAQVNIPFFKPSVLERSLKELKKQQIMKKLHDVSGGLIGDDN